MGFLDGHTELKAGDQEGSLRPGDPEQTPSFFTPPSLGLLVGHRMGREELREQQGTREPG